MANNNVFNDPQNNEEMSGSLKASSKPKIKTLEDEASFSWNVQKTAYYPGEIVEGNCTVTVNRPFSAKSFVLIKKGVEKVQLANDEQIPGSHGQFATILRTERRPWFNAESNARTFPQGEVPVGEYVLPFRFRIPEGIPASYYEDWSQTLKSISSEKQNKREQARLDKKGNAAKNADRAAVVYKIKCASKPPPGRPKVESSFKFVVLSKNATNVESFEDQKTKKFSLGGGKQEIKVSVPKKDWQLGEEIPVTVEVENKSRHDIDAVKVKLMRTYKWVAKGRTEGQTDEVYRMSFDSISSRASYKKTLNFAIKETIPASVKGDLLELKYHLQVSLDVKMHRDLSADLPITLHQATRQEAPEFVYRDYWRFGRDGLRDLTAESDMVDARNSSDVFISGGRTMQV